MILGKIFKNEIITGKID